MADEGLIVDFLSPYLSLSLTLTLTLSLSLALLHSPHPPPSPGRRAIRKKRMLERLGATHYAAATWLHTSEGKVRKRMRGR